jgi:tetratricopeptide (TPR) repeat protein
MIFVVASAHPKAAPASDPAVAAIAADAAALARSLDAIRAEQSELKKSLDELHTALSSKSSVEGRVPLGAIDAAVERALAQRGSVASQKSAVEATAAAERSAPKPKFDRETALRNLTAAGTTPEQRQAMWKEIAAAGELDAMLALFEQRTKDDPRNSTAHLELGRAYLQKLFTVGGGPEAGVWGTKADKAFDSALAIDDHNWDARFAKAVSLSFWPPMLGKQNEAIKNFEVLVDQQSAQANKPEFAQTFYFLGNMYTQTGDKEKALATWQQGLSLFPGNAQLEQQIKNAQAH